jgi:sterol desaturase/sphingolipid hydroxylase (fatty acid hydroxylase superfamily)
MYYPLVVFLYLIFINPILEYTAHYLLHKYDMYYHKSHHILYHQSLRDNTNLAIETWPFYAFVILNILTLDVMSFSMLIYFVNHTIIHLRPEWMPKISKHHHIHHKYNNCNYCVSTRWPDYLFGTIKYE